MQAPRAAAILTVVDMIGSRRTWSRRGVGPTV